MMIVHLIISDKIIDSNISCKKNSLWKCLYQIKSINYMSSFMKFLWVSLDKNIKVVVLSG